MHRVLPVLLLVLCFVASAFAQAGHELRCPTIKVFGPAGVTNPGDPITFTAEVKPYEPERMTLVWKVESSDPVVAIIEKGQGTLAIDVRLPKRSSFNVTATIDVKGLPAGCVSTASETAGVTCKCVAEAIDEYGIVSWKKERLSLANAVLKFRKMSDSMIFILKYFKHPSTGNNRYIRKVEDYLSKQKGISADRFRVLIIDNFAIEKTKIFLVPPGAEYPAVGN